MQRSRDAALEVFVAMETLGNFWRLVVVTVVGGPSLLNTFFLSFLDPWGLPSPSTPRIDDSVP